MIKQPDVNVDPHFENWVPSEGTYKIEAYLWDGTFLWRNDLGWSIEQGKWYSPYLVADLDGDGRAEVAVKTGEGDPRGDDGRVETGPEYLSIWEGDSGEERVRTDWIGRLEEPIYFYEFSSRNQLGVALLDGERPHLVVERGTYGVIEVATYRMEGGALEPVWRWSSLDEDPTYEIFDMDGYHGQGAHTLHSADVDGDGRQEVVLGAAVLDDDGAGLWSQQQGHPDHVYVGELDPERPGLEAYMGFEGFMEEKDHGARMVDAATGAMLWAIDEPSWHLHSRGLCADIDPVWPGSECWSCEDHLQTCWLHAAAGELLATEADHPDWGLNPEAVFWDADLQRELLVGGRIHDFESDHTHLAGIEGHTVAWADILGDWREELITAVPGELRVHVSTIPATDRRPSLMDDPVYRIDVVHAAMGYHQVPTPSRAPREILKSRRHAGIDLRMQLFTIISRIDESAETGHGMLQAARRTRSSVRALYAPYTRPANRRPPTSLAPFRVEPPPPVAVGSQEPARRHSAHQSMPRTRCSTRSRSRPATTSTR